MRLTTGLLAVSIVLITILCLHNKSHPHKRTPPIPAVKVASAKLIHIHQYLPVNGITQSIQSVDLVSDEPGKVMKILFHSGQLVHEGQLLIILDHEVVSAELDEADSKFEYLNKNFQRYRILAQKGIITKDNLDKLQSDLEQQKAKIHELKATLEKRFIRAPFDGVLGIKEINTGQYVNSGQRLVNLQRNDFILIDLAVPEQYSNALHLGQYVRMKDFPKKWGKLLALDSHVNNKTHSLTARVLIDNHDFTLMSGKFITAYVPLTTKAMVTIPITAVSYDLNGTSVFLLKNKSVHQTAIETYMMKDFAVVTRGIREGDQVISAGWAKLFEGETVKISARL